MKEVSLGQDIGLGGVALMEEVSLGAGFRIGRRGLDGRGVTRGRI